VKRGQSGYYAHNVLPGLTKTARLDSLIDNIAQTSAER